jgi:hypothetical protein
MALFGSGFAIIAALWAAMWTAVGTSVAQISTLINRIISMLVLIVAAVGVFLICHYYYHEHVNDVMAVTEQTWRCTLQPLLANLIGNFLYPIINAVSGRALDTFNFIGRLSRRLGARLFLDIAVHTQGVYSAVSHTLSGIGSALERIVTWLFQVPFTMHFPFYGVYVSLVSDTVASFTTVACNACDSICSLLRLISDVLHSDHLICALHNIVNGVYFTALELVKTAIITFYHMLISPFAAWNPYIPQLEVPGQTMRVGVAHLGRFVGDLVKIVYCRISSLIQTAIETSCTNECHTTCSTSCMMNMTVDVQTCMVGCTPTCLLDCHERHASDDYNYCVGTLYAADYLSDIVASILHGAVAAAWAAVGGAVQILSAGKLTGLAAANFEPLWDSLRDPRYWYTINGIWEQETNPRNSTIYIDLTNSTTSCLSDTLYPNTEVTCYECRYILMANDVNRMMSLDHVLCYLGTNIDQWIGIDQSYPIFRFLFCRLVGTAIRLAVSAARYAVKLAQALLADGLHGMFMYIGLEPNMNDLHRDLLYTCDTVGMVIPALSGEPKIYPLQYLIANPLKVAIELAYMAYMLVARIINEIVAAIDHRNYRTAGYFYIWDFFCVGTNCANWPSVLDLIIIPGTPIYDVGFVEFYEARCINGYIEGTTHGCVAGPNGTVTWYRSKECPVLVNRWDYDTNPGGRIAFAEALGWLINFNDFLDAFGVEFELPDLYCSIYHAIRVVVNLARTILQALFALPTLANVHTSSFVAYLFCKNAPTIECAPIGDIICDASAIIECPCSVFAAMGLPDCFCIAFQAVGELVRRTMAFVWAIFRSTENSNWQQGIGYITRALRLIASVDEGAPLYSVASASSCMVKLFFSQVGGVYQDICTSCDGRVSFTLRTFLVNVLQIVSYAVGIVADLIDMITGAIAGDVSGSIRNFLDSLIRTVFKILFGVQASTAPDLRYGIVGAAGMAISCIFGPVCGCQSQQLTKGTPCLGTVFVVVSWKLATLADDIVNIIMDLYDFFVGVFTGDGDAVGNSIASMFRHFQALFTHLVSTIWVLGWGIIRGISVWIFGEGVGAFITWMQNAIGGVIDSVISFMCGLSIIQGDSCDVNFANPKLAASRGGSGGSGGNLFKALRGAYEQKYVGKHFNVKRGLDDSGSYTFDELVDAIREYPENFYTLFEPGVCYNAVKRVGTDLKYKVTTADELVVRTCFSLLVMGYDYNQYQPDVYPTDFFTNPETLLVSLRQSVNAIAEYSMFALNGDQYFDSFRQSSSMLKAEAGAPPPCYAMHTMNASKSEDFDCLMSVHGITRPFARRTAAAFFTQISRPSAFHLNISRLLLGDGDSDRVRNQAHLAEAKTTARMDMLAARLRSANEQVSRVEQAQRAEQITKTILDSASQAHKAAVSYLYGANGLLVDGNTRRPITGIFDFVFRFTKGVVNVFAKNGMKAYGRTSEAFGRVWQKFSDLPTASNSYSAYKTKLGLRTSLAGLYHNFPSLIPTSPNAGPVTTAISGGVLSILRQVECDISKDWCRAALTRDRTLIQQQDRWLEELVGQARPLQPLLGTVIPSLNCEVADRVLAETFELVDEVFVNNTTYTCGQDNAHWFYFAPVANDTVLILTQNGTIAWLLKFLTTIVLPYDIDLIETFVEFFMNANTDPSLDYVGLLFYAQGLIPTIIPLFSRCYYDITSRGTFGIGLYPALSITLWILLLVVIALVVLMFIRGDGTPSTIASTIGTIAILALVTLHFTGFIAYGWSVTCVASVETIAYTFTGVPALPIIPKCMTPDLIIALNYTLDHAEISFPEEFNVDPEKHYLDSCSTTAEFYTCDRFGFADWTGSIRFAIAYLTPMLWQWLNASTVYQMIFVGNYTYFDFSGGHAPTDAQWWCFWWLLIEPLSVLGMAALGVWLLISLWPMLVVWLAAVQTLLLIVYTTVTGTRMP